MLAVVVCNTAALGGDDSLVRPFVGSAQGVEFADVWIMIGSGHRACLVGVVVFNVMVVGESVILVVKIAEGILLCGLTVVVVVAHGRKGGAVGWAGRWCPIPRLLLSASAPIVVTSVISGGRGCALICHCRCLTLLHHCRCSLLHCHLLLQRIHLRCHHLLELLLLGCCLLLSVH